MARRSYDRMYKNVDIEENNRIATIETEEKDSLPEVNIEADTKVPQTGVVIGGLSLNVRKKPALDAEIISTVKNGETVQILETANEEWYHISSPKGYVMKKYVQV